MRLTADDLKELNLMKYYRLIRKWACKTHSLKDADLELLIYLDCKKRFTRNDFIEANTHILGIKIDGSVFVAMAGLRFGVIVTVLQLNILYFKPHLNANT